MAAPRYLKPFWRYYGGKWRAAPSYPNPIYSTIVEPFAGAAGYSLRYFQRQVVLVEKYTRVAGIWRYLIGATAEEVMRVPLVEDTRDLPDWVPTGCRDLVGFSMNSACATPRVTLSSGRKKLRERGRVFEGWSEQMRERVASQVEHIRHWVIIEGDYSKAPNIEATWFIDPPYTGRAGDYYAEPASAIDYSALGCWCRERRGQTMVCENDGASWLPFQSFRTIKAMPGRGGKSVEVLFTQSNQEREMARSRAELLRAIADANASGGGNYIRDSRGMLCVKKMELASGHHGDRFVVEFVVVSSAKVSVVALTDQGGFPVGTKLNIEPHAVGDLVSEVYMLEDPKKSPGFSRAKALIVALLGQAAAGASADDIADTMDDFDKSNGARGMIIAYATRRIVTKESKKEITVTDFTNVPGNGPDGSQAEGDIANMCKWMDSLLVAPVETAATPQAQA